MALSKIGVVRELLEAGFYVIVLVISTTTTTPPPPAAAAVSNIFNY